MSAEVLFFAELKELSGKESESFKLSELGPAATLCNVLRMLFKRLPRIREFIWDDKRRKLKDNISIVVNTVAVNNENIDSHLVSDGDTIAFLTPISGG